MLSAQCCLINLKFDLNYMYYLRLSSLLTEVIVETMVRKDYELIRIVEYKHIKFKEQLSLLSIGME